MNLSDPVELSVVLEAILLAADRPLSVHQLAALFEEWERPEPALLQQALTLLDLSCKARSVELREVASGYRLQVKENFSPWVSRLWEERPQRYSRALLETLALIAYRQPITRGEIEEVRGVTVSSQIIKTLQEREWIRVVGHKEVPGRPALLATTSTFLDYFNLKHLGELPPLATLKGGDEPAEPVVQEGPVSVPCGEASTADTLSFRSLLQELDNMEQGLKTDFDDSQPAGDDVPSV